MSVTPADLTGTERAVLRVLVAEARPVPNPDLVALGPKLDKPGRDKLNRLGLIESRRSGGRFVHELTDRGWHLCRDIFGDGPPPRSAGPAKTLAAQAAPDVVVPVARWLCRRRPASTASD